MFILHTQYKMASLGTLPVEVLEKIILNTSERPFKTGLLLLNKTLCSLFMTEQVRNLYLTSQQTDPWITTITNNDISSSCSVLRYCNLLDKIIELKIFFEKKFSERTIAGIINRCTNLLKLELYVIYSYIQFDPTLIIPDLPTSIIEIDFTGLIFGSGDRYARSLVSYARQNKKLEKLYLSDVDIDVEGIRTLGEFLKLDPVIKIFGLRKCTSINLGFDVLTEALKQNVTLTNLDLSDNSIDFKCVYNLGKALEQNTTLTDLNLTSCGINAFSIKTLARGLTTLTNLNLSYNEIASGGGAHTVADKILKQNTTITNVNLARNRIGDNGVGYLAKALKQNTTLTNLNLKRNEIGAGGAHALAEALKQRTALTNPNLGNNEIGDGVTCALVEGTALTDLDLSDNEINEDGARALSEGLKLNTALTNLNISSNKIGDGGARALAECLKLNTVLRNLNIANNNIGDEGAYALTEGLKLNTALTNLNISYNKIGEAGARALGEGLKLNTVITKLNFKNNGINGESGQSLREYLKLLDEEKEKVQILAE